jgi:bacteriocin biosynthesis cyclodehydratase domain-containing protein
MLASVRPALKAGLLPVWRDSDTLQFGIDSRRAVALTGMAGLAALIGLLDGSRDRMQVLQAAAEHAIPAAAVDRVLTLLAAGGVLDDFPAGTLRALSQPRRSGLAGELATVSLARQDTDGGARALARRRAAQVSILETGSWETGRPWSSRRKNTDHGTGRPASRTGSDRTQGPPRGTDADRSQDPPRGTGGGRTQGPPRGEDADRSQDPPRGTGGGRTQDPPRRTGNDRTQDPTGGSRNRAPGGPAGGSGDHGTGGNGPGRIAALIADLLSAAGVDVISGRTEPPGERGGATGRPAARRRVARRAPRSGGLPDLAVIVGQAGLELPAGLMSDRTPHLNAYASEAIGVVGPFVLPGRTACLRCLDHARTDRDPAWPVILAQLAGRQPVPLACDAPLSAAVAAQAAFQALAFIDGAAVPGAVTNGTLELVLPAWQWRRRTWSPHPACGCGSYPAR